MPEYTYDPPLHSEELRDVRCFDEDEESVRTTFEAADRGAYPHYQWIRGWSRARSLRDCEFRESRVGLVGDPDSGKTTALSAWAADRFTPSSPSTKEVTTIAAPALIWPPPGQTYLLGDLPYGYLVQEPGRPPCVVAITFLDIPGQAHWVAGEELSAIKRLADERLGRSHQILICLDASKEAEFEDQILKLQPRLAAILPGQRLLINFTKADHFVSAKLLSPSTRDVPKALNDFAAHHPVLHQIRHLVGSKPSEIVTTVTYAADLYGTPQWDVPIDKLEPRHYLGGAHALLLKILEYAAVPLE